MKDLIFNELSTKAYPANFDELSQRISKLMEVCKAVKEHFGFKKLRFTEELPHYQLLENYSFIDFLQDPKVKRSTKDLLMSLKRYPFIDDTDSNELAGYVENSFSVNKDNKDIRCDGLAVAYLYDTLAVSLLSENYWEHTTITITIHKESEKLIAKVLHISKPEHLQKDTEITEWLRLKLQKGIETLLDLEKLYPNYQFENEAFEDILYWQQQDTQLYEKLHLLLKDIVIHPIVGGLGKTEPLKHGKKGFSKRLTQEHRLQYDIEGEGANQKITVFRCRWHYED
jgi:toxin YoeB